MRTPTASDHANPLLYAAHIIADTIEEKEKVQKPIFPEEDRVTGPFYIRKEKAEEIANYLLAVIAEVHADFIDAGSEREVILEDDDLRQALVAQFSNWDGPPNT